MCRDLRAIRAMADWREWRKKVFFFSFSSPTADVHIERENGDGPRILLSK